MNQRAMTIYAAKLAGFWEPELINAPLAVALSSYNGSNQTSLKVIIVYGGNTLDVSVVNMSAGILKVLATNGDSGIAGEDLDYEMVEDWVKEFENQSGINCRDNGKAMRRLKTEAQKIKHVLSTASEA